MSLLTSFLPPGINIGFTIAKYIAYIVAFIGICLMISTGVDKVEGYFGMTTKESLQKTVSQQANTIDTQKKVNDSLVKAATNEVASSKVTDTVVSNNVKTVNDIKKKAVVEDNKRISSITVIEDNAKITKEDPLVTEAKISTVQITSIWNTYCSYNSNPTCSNIKE